MDSSGWSQAKSDTTHNPELHAEGGAHRQLRQRVFGTLTALIVLLLIAIVIGFME